MESEADSVGNLANPPILRLPEPDAAALGCRFPVADSQVIQGCLQTTKTTMTMTMTMTAKFSTIATMISRSIQTTRGKMEKLNSETTVQ
ncbi:MAG: hypothetical protein MK524_10630 [SAR202 cluster bacterium]|nr:hypothetical protein [SAR202 cluster bacterium]